MNEPRFYKQPTLLIRFARLLLAVGVLILTATGGFAPSDAQDRDAHSGAVSNDAPSESGFGSPRRAVAYVFWQAGCPYCADGRAFLEKLAARDPGVSVRPIQVGVDPANERVFAEVVRRFGIDRPAVPIIVVGEKYFVGYGGDRTTGAAVAAQIAECRATGCEDVVGRWIKTTLSPEFETRASEAEPSAKATPQPIRPPIVALPVFGEIDTGALSLPMLTIVLAAVDGFNPCAMWVLVFLIGLLLGARDTFRMWSLGLAFLVASAAVYFAFMAAWLNVVLLLGGVLWLRVGIGALAMAGGGYYIFEFVRNPEGVCKVTNVGQRRRIMDRLREVVADRSFIWALLGIVSLALVVNMIELLCSAGIPAIYTQVLSLSQLPLWQYYAYLLLYIGVFLLDDLLIFATAMLTLQSSGAAALYTRYAHLVGGVVMLAIGALLLFRPELLRFGG